MRGPRRWWSPALAVLLLAPYLGETLSTATPPLDLLLPWNLALMVALYGCGALLCREVARRCGLGLLGLVLLGAAYGAYEEGLIDRYWFNTEYWHDSGVGTYSEVWHTNLLLAAHLTVFHAAVSICCSVLIVERLFPDDHDRAWSGTRGLVVAGLVLGVGVPFFTADFPAPDAVVLVAAGVVCVALVVAAFLSRRMPRPVRPERAPRRGLGLVAFLATGAHFVLVYAVSSTGLPWPLGAAVALAPVVLGALVVHRWAVGGVGGRDELRVVTGILSFFLALDLVIGLGGRYDLSLGAVAGAGGLWWLNRRSRRVEAASAHPAG